MYAMGVGLSARDAVRWASAVCVAFLVVGGTAVSRGDVVFDASPAVACRDITPAGFQDEHPQEKIIEARVQVSTLIYRGVPDDLVEVFYQFANPERSSEIVDYLPKTRLGSDYAGNIAYEKSGEQRNELTVGATGQFNSVIQANAGGIHGTIGRTAVRYELLPPQELLTASGTIDRGTGVYYKLRRSAQVSLEGAREFVLMLRVPAAWRGDYLRLACEARGNKGPATTATFLVPLYLIGDSHAQEAAEALGRAERQLLNVAKANRREIERRSLPTLAHEWALVDPKIPGNWLALVAHRPVTNNSHLQFEQYLPEAVREASSTFQRAKQELHALCGTPSPSLREDRA